MNTAPGREVLRLESVTKIFDSGQGSIRKDSRRVVAAREVSFSLSEGRTLALVGESGSGKSTIGRIVARLINVSSGRVLYDGVDITSLRRHQLRQFRRDVQMVFQDPYSCLDPRMPIFDSVAEPLRANGRDARRRVREVVPSLLDRVGISRRHYQKYPGELSGGQRQRVGIARALTLSPKVMILDEPVSALDVSVQAQVLNLLADLQQEYRLSYLFVSHDLSVVRRIADDIAVMYLGSIVEYGDSETVYRSPEHPYTKALLSAIPVEHPAMRGATDRIIPAGQPLTPIELESGCAFRGRCWRAAEVCTAIRPTVTPVSGGGLTRAACFFPLSSDSRGASNSVSPATQQSS